MSSDDENITTHPEPRYHFRSNTQSFEPISLSSRSSRWYHQASTTPSSSNTTSTTKSCVVALDKSQASLVVGDNEVDGNCSTYKY
jgi:hypothetical protein